MSAVRRNIGQTFGIGSIKSAAEEVVAAALRGLEDAADFVLEESKKQVPAEDGRHDIGGLNLKETGTVDMLEGKHKAAIHYGGPYAVYQHELLHLKHEHGGNAKFLERPLIDNREREYQIIADAIREVTGGD